MVGPGQICKIQISLQLSDYDILTGAFKNSVFIIRCIGNKKHHTVGAECL